MQGHRLLRAVAVLILIVAFVYFVLALVAALQLGGSGFGSGWGTGWTGWLVLPLVSSAIMAGLTLLVFGLMLFFLAKIDNNLAAARQRPRVQRKPAAVVAPSTMVAPAAVTTDAYVPPLAPAEPRAATAVSTSQAPVFESETPAVQETITLPEAAVRTAMPLPPVIDESAMGEDVRVGVEEPPLTVEPAVDAELPRAVFGQPVGEVIVPGGILPSVEVTEERLPEVELPKVEITEERLPEVELPVEAAPIVSPEVQPADVPAASPDLILREPVQVEVEAGAPEIGLPEVEISEVAASAPDVELPRVDLSAEPVLETEDMAAPEWTPPPAAFDALAMPEVRLPQVEVTEVPQPDLTADAAAVTLSDAIGVPEPELGSAERAPVSGTRMDTLEAEIAALRAQLAALQSQLGQPAPAPAAPPSVTETRAAAISIQEPTDALAEEPPAARLPGADEVARIAAEMNALKSAPPRAPNAGGGDNLEIIMGVGPIYAKRLREGGITTYAQLADASYEVLEKVTRGNLERVIQEDWRGQARRLMNRD